MQSIGLLVKTLTDADIDSLNIDTSTKDVGSNEDSLFEALELLVSVDSLLLWDTSVDANTWEVALNEQLVEFVGSGNRLDKDDYLIKFE